MKKTLPFLLLAVIAATTAQAELNISVNIGAPPPRRVIVSTPPHIRFEIAPLFIASSLLGFYVGVDTPYDILFYSDYYYLYYSNSWHRSHHHNGPWLEVPYRELPPGIRKHRIEQIRSYREREYRKYNHDRKHYRGRYFRPDHERHLDMMEERRSDKDEWEEEHKGNKHDHGRD